MGSFFLKNQQIESVSTETPPSQPDVVNSKENITENKIEDKQIEKLNKKEWFGLISILFFIFIIGSLTGWFAGKFDNANYKEKLRKTLSLLEAEKKQTQNIIKKNEQLHSDFKNKLSELSFEFVNLKNTYQSNLTQKDNEIRLLKTNLSPYIITNTVSNIVTITVTNKIPTELEQFKIDLNNKINNLDTSIKKESEDEEADSEKIEKLNKSKKTISDSIVEIDKFKQKNHLYISNFIQSQIKSLNKKGVKFNYKTNSLENK